MERNGVSGRLRTNGTVSGNGVASESTENNLQAERHGSLGLEKAPPPAVAYESKAGRLRSETKFICVLAIVLFYFAFFEYSKPEWYLQITAWINGAIFFFAFASFPFPSFRPVVYIICLCYEVFLIWAAGQNLPVLRGYFHNKTSNPMLEVSYDNDCDLYHPSNPAHVIHAVWTKMDHFVWFHIVGYVFKFLLVRSWWMCHALSVAFELAEYSFEHHLPNFKECWWDHWIMDALVTNTLGIWLGMKIVELCDLERYQWRFALHPIRRRHNATEGSAIQKRIKFFRPPIVQLKNFMVLLLALFFILMSEVNTFYMKFLLWLPPEHPFNAIRIVITLATGVPAIHDTYYQLQDRPSKLKFTMAMTCSCMVLFTELILYLMLGVDEFLVPFPKHVLQLWAGILLVSIIWALWRFFLRYVIYGYDKEERQYLAYLERIQQLKKE